MTRKDEEIKGYKVSHRMILLDNDMLHDRLKNLQAERECWAKAVDKLDTLLSMENESTDDQAWEFLAWLRDQLKEVER